MKIGLVGVDGHHFPNLALMKLSAWHKEQGDAVDRAPLGAKDKTGVMIFDKMTGVFHGDMPRKIADEFIQKLA